MLQIPYNPGVTVRNSDPGGQQYDLHVNADMFGANVGRGLAGLGDAVDRLGNVVANEALKMQGFKQETDLTNLKLWADKALQDGANNNTGDGTQFQSEFDKGFKEQAEVVKKQYPNSPELSQKINETYRGYIGKVHGITLQKMNTYYKTQLDDKFNTFLDDVGKNPTASNLEQAHKSMLDMIDKSGMGAETKEAYKAYAKKALDAAYAYGETQTNQEKVVGTNGGATSFERKVAAQESGNEDIGKHRGSSAWGKFGITAGTWTSIANSAEGKRLGLDPLPEARKDPKNNAIGFRILTRMNEQSLRSAEFVPDEKNLYLAHFMGAGRAVELLQKLETSPNSDAASQFPAAASANPSVFFKPDGRGRTIAELYAFQTRNFGDGSPTMPKSDPVYERLDLATRDKVQGLANRVLDAKAQSDDVQAKKDYAEFLNDTGLRIRAGIIGKPEVDEMVATGKVSDMKDIQKLEGWLKSYGETNEAFAYATGKLSRGEGFNPFSKDDKAGVNAIAEKIDGNQRLSPKDKATAYYDLASKTGIVPEQFMNSLQQGINSANAQMQLQTAQTLVSLLANRPDIFNGVSNGEDLKRVAADYQGLLQLGYGDSAGAKLTERLNTKARSEFKPDENKINEVMTKLQADPIVTGAQKLVDAGITGRFFGEQIPPGVGRAAAQDYANEFAYAYRQTGDEARADNYAKQRLSQAYGTFNDQVMKFPPQKAGYEPDIEGGFGYLKRDLEATALRNTGRKPERVELQATTNTMADVLAGKPARYDVLVLHKDAAGVETWSTLRDWSVSKEQMGRANADIRAKRRRQQTGEVLPSEVKDVPEMLKNSGVPSAEARAKGATATGKARREEALKRADEDREAAMSSPTGKKLPEFLNNMRRKDAAPE